MILTADYLLKITRHTCKDKVLPGASRPHGFVAVILNSHKHFLQLIFSCALYVVLPTQSSTAHLLGHKWCLIRGYFCRKILFSSRFNSSPLFAIAIYYEKL